MKLNLGLGSGTESAGGDASKNAKILYNQDGMRVMQYKSPTYWKFYVYRVDVFPKEEKDPERFGREFFNIQFAQRNFNALKTTNNVIKLPNK